MPIRLYRSSVAGNVPTAGDLDYGELALNFADGRLYFKDSGGVIRTIASTSAFLLTTEYRYDSSTSAVDPGDGDLRLNNSTWAATTELYIDTNTGFGTDASLVLAYLGAGDLLLIQDKDSSADHVRYRLTGSPVDNTGWWTIPVEFVSSTGTLWANNTKLTVMVQHAGDAASLDHNLLDNLQGGTAAEYYHLTDAEYTGTGTGVFVRAGSPDIIGAKLALPAIYDPGFLASLAFRDSGGVGYDLTVSPLNDPTGDTWLYLPDGGGIFDYETLARLSDIPAPVPPSFSRTFAFMGS